MEWSKRRDDIVSKDMLRDKGVLRLRNEEKCLSRGGSARSELGNFCLFILLSTGELNTRWLSHTWTSW